jgi:hypothetical protein
MGQNLSRRSYIACRWPSIRKTSNSRWSRRHQCQGRTQAISIWLNYGTISTCIQSWSTRGFQNVLKLKKYSLRWVPHTLNDDKKAVRVEMAASMLSILEPLTAHVRSWVLAGDESWFYFSYDYEGKWALARDPSMTKPKALINTSKIMVLVIWGVGEAALVEIVLSNRCVSAKSYANLQFPIWNPTWKCIAQNKTSNISPSIRIMHQVTLQ